MSQHSDDQQLMQVGSDSFWEPGNYKRTTRRLDDGHRLCADLSQLVAERADIEKTYAKSLKGWAKKWNDLIEKGPEYGTTEAAWKGVLVEAERLCDLHLKVRDRLVEDVTQQIKNWQKDNYHKTMMNIKERKEVDEAFKKAQKPWVKRLQKVERAKADYHTACKQERTAHNQERNATGDTSLSPDQRALAVKKMGERVSRSKEEVTKTREKYQVALAEINAYNPRYVEDMGGVFDRCQAMEAQRLLFFKDVLFGVHKSINISQDPLLPQIYEEFYHTISNADHHKDLKWWSNNHGVNMPMAWPQFEEYVEEFREIAKGKSKESIPTGQIRLINQRSVAEDTVPEEKKRSLKKIKTKIRRKSRDRVLKIGKQLRADDEDSYLSERQELPPVNSNNKLANSTQAPVGVVPTRTITTVNTVSSAVNSVDKKPAIQNGTGGGAPGSGSAPNSGGGNSPSSATGATGAKDNPFEEEEWDEEDGASTLVDNGEPGVPVRALYDYSGAESDELSFRQGDIFEKLEAEDEQGWCKGRKDGRVGLYPANYVEPTGH